MKVGWWKMKDGRGKMEEVVENFVQRFVLVSSEERNQTQASGDLLLRAEFIVISSIRLEQSGHLSSAALDAQGPYEISRVA
jgi:hypothetical protein